MNCHGAEATEPRAGERPVVLVGNPNVGKSALFSRLTGRYVTVANYPGTTVEVARGVLALNGHRRPVIDTPGLQGLVPITEDERVARDIVLDGIGTAVLVADTKNLRRALLLAIEFAELEVPFVLALNMRDEAERRGIAVDAEALADAIGVPVVGTVATRGVGVPELAERLGDVRRATFRTEYQGDVEAGLQRIGRVLPVRVGTRGLAAMLLVGDREVADRLGISGAAVAEVDSVRRDVSAAVGEPLGYALHRSRLAAIDRVLEQVVGVTPVQAAPGERLGRLAQHPIVGWPVLIGVLVVMYLFVGWFGATTLVGWLEEDVFGRFLNPWATRVVETIVPLDLLRDFLVGEYGLVTMALTYGFAIVLPIVVTFFLAFGALEDSGYLPRLAVMLDRVFRVMGLNGRAVMPMVLGLGCDTMATVTTRTLESRRERIQVTLLLALAVPCSAQLGVILGMISQTGAIGISIWSTIVVATLLGVGWLAARVIPGGRSDFIVELPPMRLPSLGNIAVKTAARLEWYLKEVIPIFVVGTAALFALDRIGLLVEIERILSPVVVGWLGLPRAATGAFLIGFLRRDYGAAGLFALAAAGELTPNQMLVAIVVITLFVPCIANLMMIVREHGRRVAVAVAAFVFPFAVLVGGALNAALGWLGVEVG